MATGSARILLVHCPDRPGLVHEITGVVFRAGFNITSNAEFVDSATGRFFMRTVFEGSGDPRELSRRLAERLPVAAQIRLVARRPRVLAILASKEYHCVGDLLLRHDFGELNARIAAVISNHATLQGLVERFGVPFVYVPHDGLTREQHEERILEVLRPLRPDYLVLARYMRILSPEFVERYRHRIVNIHHSFLPAFAGAHPYRKAFERGVKIIGATAHFVTAQLDEGPIVAQNVLPVDHTYTVRDLVRVGRDVERTVLAAALQLVLDDRVFIWNNRTIIL